MLRKGHGGLYKAPTMEERRKRKAKRREREIERERDQIKFIDLRFERWQVLGFRKAKESKTLHKLHVLGMNEDLWDTFRGLGREAWKGCE